MPNTTTLRKKDSRSGDLTEKNKLVRFNESQVIIILHQQMKVNQLKSLYTT